MFDKMFIVYIFAIVINGVISITPCKDGVEIITQETKNPEDLLGNWTYVYHWDPKLKFEKEFIDISDLECPQLHFKAATPEFIKAKQAECAEEKIPFNWDDVKLRVDAPVLKMDGGMVILGEKENWMAVDCITMVRVVIKKFTDNYIAMANPDKNSEAELLVRETPTLDELKCVVHNVDVRQGITGIGLCYKK